jgi:hypothetical protein
VAKVALAVVAGAAVFAWLLVAFDTESPSQAPLAPSESVPPPIPAVPMPGDPAAPPVAGAPVTPESSTIEGDASFLVRVWPVRLDGARLRVFDMDMSNDLDRVLAQSGASIVLNGGFFDKARRLEGLVVSGGAMLSPKSESLGGGIMTVAGGRGMLLAAADFVGPSADFAVQARPRLVVNGASVIVKDDGHAAERTAWCLRKGGRWLEVVIARGDVPGAGPTLGMLADVLVSRGCEDALNLDGGPSTGVAWREEGGVRAMIPRGPIRHAIAIWLAAPR